MDRKKLLQEDNPDYVLLKRKIEEKGGDKGNVWIAPIWRLDVLNGNGRVYPTELAQRLVAAKASTPVRDGHDDYGTEYKGVVGVAENPYIQDGKLFVEITILDEEYNALLAGLVDHGVPIGVSSVGYGDQDIDGRIDPASYVLVRYCDFVTQPAGDVYAHKSESKDKGSDAGTPAGGKQPKPSGDDIDAGMIARVKEAHDLKTKRKQ
jgi:hypothetical protein